MRRLYFDCGDKTQFPALLISRVEMKEGSTVCCSLLEGGREFPFSFLPLLPHLTKCRSSVSRRIMSSTDRRGELTDVLPCLHCGTLLKMNYCCKSAVTMTPRAQARAWQRRFLSKVSASYHGCSHAPFSSLSGPKLCFPVRPICQTAPA